MKLFILIFIILSSLFIGCSTTYTTSDFQSKGEFIKQFNKHCSKKDLNVVFKDDSTKNISDGTVVGSDSLSINIKAQKVDSAEIPLSEIGYIAYKNENYTSAHIMLSNGKNIDADNMVFLQSILKYNTKEDLLIKKNIPLNSVKEVNYKTYIASTFTGILCGIVGGFLVTISKIIPANIREGNPPYPQDDYDYYQVGLGSISLGILAGGITGYFIGHSYHYKFNQ